MLVTFVVPTFNRAYCVCRAIDSVLNQRHLFANGFELVVVDDGSTDSTMDKLKKYALDREVIIISFGENHGLAAARNTAFKHAKGRWCAFLDSDNALLPNVANFLEHTLISVPNDIGVVWADCQTKDGRSTIAHNKGGWVSGREISSHTLLGEHFSIIRTDIVLQNQFPMLGTRHACEPAFWARLSRVTNFWVERRQMQYYETKGEDRFCSLKVRLSRAEELIKCYSYTAEIVADTSPRYYWELRGKVAFYTSIKGDWFKAVKESLGLLKGIRYAMKNCLIVVACILGPQVSRWLLRCRNKEEKQACACRSG